MAGEIDFGALRTPDFVGGAIKAQQLGQQEQVRQQRQNALRDYATDPATGVREMMSVDPAAALTLQDAQSKVAASQARSTAGKLYASGDAAGAKATALQSGDFQLIDAIGKLDDQKRAELQREADVKATAALTLKSLPYEQRKPKLMEMAPQLSQSGLTPDQINAFDPTDTNIDGIINQAVGIKSAIDAADKARKPVEMDPGKNYYLPDSTYGGPPSGGGGQPAPGAQPAAAPGATPTAGEPLDADTVWQAVKQQESGGNGNAVNPQTGATGSTQLMMPTAEAMARKLGVAWNPGLMRGDTPRALAYQDKLGRAYFEEGLQKSGGDVAGALAYYYGGPDPAQHGPKTAQYVSDVLGRLGAQPYQVAANGQTPPPPAPTIPGYHLVQRAGQVWQPDGKGTLINTVTGDRKKDDSFQAPDVAPDPNLVQAILDGRAPVPANGRQATDPKWQAAFAAAMAQDPSLDAANYGTRVKTRIDFATGSAAKTKTALNTALGHAGDLDGQVDALHNSRIPALNSVKNFAETQTGDPRVKTFELTKEALMHEAMKVFSGSAGSLMEFNQLAETLKPEDSPAQQHAVIRKLVGLLASKMDALGEQYRTGMGKELDQSQIMSPHAQQVFSRISGIPMPAAQAPAAPPSANRPPLSSFYRPR